MDNLVEILVPLGAAVVLPICVVSIIFRSAMAEDRNRKEIMKKSEKLIKEKLLARLERGCLCCLMGVAFILLYFFCEVIRTDMLLIVGVALIPIGIAFLISYFVGRHMLAKEMEAEQQNMKQE